MRINGSNFLLNANLLPVEELNLKDGQKVIGKVISASTDEALLEMSGRSFRAKIEGDPKLESGAVLKFQVNHDQQGRVLLKVLNGAQEANNIANSELSGKQIIDPNLLKTITIALTKEGLPVNQENIDNFLRLIESFQNKYQQSLPPQVLAFITAQKWQINTETIMTSWLYQDTDLRDLLWNMLRQSGSEQSGTNLLARLILGMSSKPEELQVKLETLIKQMETLFRYVNENGNNATTPKGQSQTAANGLFRHLLLTDDSEINPLLRQLLTKLSPEVPLRQSNPDRNPDSIVKNSAHQTQSQMTETTVLKAPLFNELKQLFSKLTATFEHQDLREKIEVLLDRNLALNKAVLQENSINGNFNLVPFLVNDSQNMLHEVLIKWQDKSSERKGGKGEQVLQMNIPTENLGEVRLSLRTGANGIQIIFKVDNDLIRKYLLRNLTELKESVKRKDVMINVALEPRENSIDSAYYGVDLWI